MASTLRKAHGSRKVQVTILASEWGSSKGGLSTINREIAIQLAKFPEVEITFFVPKCSQEDREVAFEYSISIEEATRRPGFKEIDWLSFPPKHLQIDIIVGHGVKLGKQAQVIKERYGCRWIQVVHTDPEELGMFKNYSTPISKGEEKHKVEVELCGMADQVVGVGPKLSEAFRSSLRSCQKDDNVLDFTPGVFEEFAAVKQVPCERQQRSVLVFGRGDVEDFELKGFDIAGKAVAELEDIRLVFVGAPEGKHEEIANRLVKCGVPARHLRVRGFVKDRESLKGLFQEVDLVVMPSRTEGFGLTGLEALSAGLPVLVSRNSGFGETLLSVPFGSSFVVDSEDPSEWASAIRRILVKGRENRLSEAKTVRDSYGKKYNWAKQAKYLIDKMITWVHDKSFKAPSSLGTKRKASQMEGIIENQEAKDIFSHLRELQSDTVQVSNKTNLSSDLRRIAANKGFVVSDNQASGNCLFYALSEQLQSVKGIEISHRELRVTLVQFLRGNANLHDGTPLFNFVSGYPSWPEYLQSMAMDGTWGDHVVLLAAANYFQTPIRIISSLNREIVVQPDHAVVATSPLVLGHIHEFHYVSLQPRQESSHSEYHVACVAGAGFLVGFYRAREGKTRAWWNLRSKKSKKTVACYSGECGGVKRKKKNNDEVIMENRQTEADGRKNIIDLTASGFKIKKGTPSYEVLEVLAHRISPDCWTPLGRRLEIDESRLIAFDRENPQCREKAYRMLRFWKEKDGSDASYRVLYDALCHNLVGLRQLAEEVCCD